VEEERERLPEWACTLEALQDSRAKLDRKEGELALADVIMCPSRFVEESLPEGARRDKRVFVVPFGSPVGPARAHGVDHFRATKLKVLFVGSMSQRKGLADLFAAMRSLDPSQFELHVLGSPVAEPSFYRSQFDGFVHHAGRSNREVMDLMSSCHVFVLPSLVEGRALVQQEAMASGLPVVVTRNAGGEDLVEDGRAGFLIPIRDPQAIAERLELLYHDRERLAAMSEAACRKAKSLTWESYRERVAAFVREALTVL
jgi:glycosyltransferase involved in cell wall biosynthesis